MLCAYAEKNLDHPLNLRFSPSTFSRHSVGFRMRSDGVIDFLDSCVGWIQFKNQEAFQQWFPKYIEKFYLKSQPYFLNFRYLLSSLHKNPSKKTIAWIMLNNSARGVFHLLTHRIALFANIVHIIALYGFSKLFSTKSVAENPKETSALKSQTTKAVRRCLDDSDLVPSTRTLKAAEDLPHLIA